ncbi:PepSY-associated TM helix domain-containing protein [Archangium lansingense]|uniref:PepSY-associated TM helix domain-containing protein n=1 Tax=Archangium lansingense TaxID=2995310 RepID=A0ABT4AMW4_9BACT|nr:PepSY-associated TM helix domain-containing protein [Archangium lansinium]MCY1082916.1 PepSY-associated TM helix domain-containing protein [Archangium lansinium]
MSITLRKIIFWPHLVSGIIAGIVIGIMSLTGVAIAFEPQILAWADSDARRVQVPSPDAPRLTVDELVARVRAERPKAQPSGVTVYPEPDSVVLVLTGRSEGVYVNPYTGEVREQGAQGWRSFFHVMEEWHRWLGAHGDNRPVGKAITGVSNAAFLFLAISGLYLWWPRKWTLRAMRPTLWFRRGLKGKARDFNWHNTIGFWSLPVLIVLTTSGMVISYKWASDLVFKLTGNQPPAAQGPAAAPPVKVPTPPEGAKPIGLEPLFAEARKQVPAWETITVRLGGGSRPNAPQGQQAQGPQAQAPGPQAQGPQGPRPGNGPGANEPRGGGPQALTFAIREQGGWPLFASAQVSFDPFTGNVLRTETFADYNLGRKVRTWMRFLHTGEALGWMGQLLAAIASLGGVVLVWTGFALSWRRFFPRRRPANAPAEPEAAPAEPETAL